MSDTSSFLENFGVPEDMGYTSSEVPPKKSAKDIYNRRKTFQKKASLKEDVSEYHVKVDDF